MTLTQLWDHVNMCHMVTLSFVIMLGAPLALLLLARQSRRDVRAAFHRHARKYAPTSYGTPPTWFRAGQCVIGVQDGVFRTGRIIRVSTAFTHTALVAWDIDPQITYPDPNDPGFALRAYWTLESLDEAEQ
jgi:hypothetical protein